LAHPVTGEFAEVRAHAGARTSPAVCFGFQLVPGALTLRSEHGTTTICCLSASTHLKYRDLSIYGKLFSQIEGYKDCEILR
jgi:hypothetical protein